MDSLYSAFIIEADQPSRDQLHLFDYAESQHVANSMQVATRAFTNVPRSGDSGLPTSWEMYVQRWRASTNLRIDEPIMDWAAETSVRLVFNGRTVQSTPLLDLIMAPHAFYNVEATEDRSSNAIPAGPIPLWMRENISFHVDIMMQPKAIEQLQTFLLEHTRGHRMICWLWLDGVLRRGVS